MIASVWRTIFPFNNKQINMLGLENDKIASHCAKTFEQISPEKQRVVSKSQY